MARPPQVRLDGSFRQDGIGRSSFDQSGNLQLEYGMQQSGDGARAAWCSREGVDATASSAIN